MDDVPTHPILPAANNESSISRTVVCPYCGKDFEHDAGLPAQQEAKQDPVG